MYYPIGLPKCLKANSKEDGDIQSIICNRDRILFAILSEHAIWIWYSRPCVPLIAQCRSWKCVQTHGTNFLVEWRPDSSKIVVATNKNILIFYDVLIDGNHKEVYEQDDSPMPSLRRYSAELYTKERIPPLTITKACQVALQGNIKSLVCLRDELMVSTDNGHIHRVKWNGTINQDYCINLSRIPFCDDQLVMKAVPLDVPGMHVIHLEYSPLVGGFAIVFNDGRAAFLTASTLQFDPNAVQGIWARDLEDATCAAINHKYRLLAFGRENAQGVVMMVDEATGGLEMCHRLALSSKDYSGQPGRVCQMRWTPDGTVLGLCWKGGGFSLWSVFGSLLSCSLKWDYSDHPLSKPPAFKHMEWGAEGYEAWCIQETSLSEKGEKCPLNLPPLNSTESSSHTTPTNTPHLEEIVNRTSVLQLTFIKSALTVNPCMSRLERVLLQGSDRLYLSTKEGVDDVNVINSTSFLYDEDEDYAYDDPSLKANRNTKFNPLSVAASKQWLVVPIPYTYTAANWPIRYTCIDDSGEFLGVAGRNGVAHYSIKKRKWRLFGNENQEEDLVVTGGLLWWKNDWLVLGAYSIPDNADQIRLYPKNQKLDNEFVTIVAQPAQVLLLNIYCNLMIALTADCRITVYNMKENESLTKGSTLLTINRIQEVDISGLTVHPACVISVGLTSLRTESWRSHSSRPVQPPAQSIIFNISGKVLMIQRDHTVDPSTPSSSISEKKLFQSAQMTPIVLASCCESLWCATRTVSHKPHLSHALWLHCGAHGTRAWLPLFPSPGAERGHTFMARRIMLPFTPSIYPLAVLFEEAIMIGAETDTSILACDKTILYQPLAMVEKTSQVYLHHLLRQLLRRNLGYHAWEVASTCRLLPYFPHALELLLHQVLEEEATSKDPIPDSLLPRVLDFIREFPVHLLTVVQCARKTELALWRYLFTVAGSPRHLFTQALQLGELETAASYLLILQNLESAMVSRSHATLLLDATLEAAKWDLSKDLIRFLRSIDPNDLESPKTSAPLSVGTRIGFSHATPPVSPQCADEDLSMIMPNTQALRGRSFSSASGPKAAGAANFEGTANSQSANHHAAIRTVSDSAKRNLCRHEDMRKISSGSSSKDISTTEEYFLDVILQTHAKKLLLECRLRDLGTMAAHLDFPLVSWLRNEKNGAASVERFVPVLKQVHADFSWPFPSSPNAGLLHKLSGSSMNSQCGRLQMVDDRMQQLSITVPKVSSLCAGEIGDSGYLSQSTNTADTGGTPLTPQHVPHSHLNLPILSNETITHDAMLLPHSVQSGYGDILSVMSEECSVYGDETVSNSYGDCSPDDPTRNLLLRSPDPPPQAHPKPPPYAEVQLRYLLQIFIEAGCLELSIILAVVLRDALAILRVVSLARAPDTPLPVLCRLVTGLTSLKEYTNTQCLGYQNFMSAVMDKAKVLQRLAEVRNGSTKSNKAKTLPESKKQSSTEINSLKTSSVSSCEDAIMTTKVSSNSSKLQEEISFPENNRTRIENNFIAKSPEKPEESNSSLSTDVNVDKESSTACTVS